MEAPEGSLRQGSPIRAVIAVAATYIYFLLFAQFGFLHLLAARGGGPDQVKASMLSMGAAGLLASLGTGFLLGRSWGSRLLPLGFLACSASAVAALWAESFGELLAVAMAVGVSTAVLTVSLAASLGTFLPGRSFGKLVGLGTGLAYGFCNLPFFFEGSALVQAEACAAVALLGFVAVRRSPAPGPEWAEHPHRPALGDWDFRRIGFATLLASFLALVWLDSAAFAVIQETLGLKGLTWGSESRLWILGATHFLAAAAAGWAIDRGIFRGLLPITFALFLVAFTLLQGGRPPAFAGPLYAVGISFYSVALVAYPAYRGSGPRRIPVRWRSALLYGIAGWVGSALGVGMAQDLHRIPGLFLVAAGSLLFAAWVWSRQRNLLFQVRQIARIHAGALAVAALAGILGLAASGTHEEPAPPGPNAERGREVYISEGCIHCHSQYVRPSGADIDLWGPHRPLPRDPGPPLPGNRRQGPDLATVGLRRSSAWNRQHLLDPRSVSPGSRMPAYPHLFKDGEGRGEDLVAYLTLLGAGDAQERWNLTRGYTFRADLKSGRPESGRALFLFHCSPCHGARGDGDGTLADIFFRPAANLRKGAFWSVSWGPGAGPLSEGLGRVIKFGIPGTSMPGHESLPDRQIADLVAYVQTLADSPPEPSPRTAGESP